MNHVLVGPRGVAAAGRLRMKLRHPRSPASPSQAVRPRVITVRTYTGAEDHIESDLMGIPHSTNGSRDGEPDEPLAPTVERLRAELERARDAGRGSAVVEQAKGLLAERLGCGVDA